MKCLATQPTYLPHLISLTSWDCLATRLLSATPLGHAYHYLVTTCRCHHRNIPKLPSNAHFSRNSALILSMVHVGRPAHSSPAPSDNGTPSTIYLQRYDFQVRIGKCSQQPRNAQLAVLLQRIWHCDAESSADRSWPQRTRATSKCC